MQYPLSRPSFAYAAGRPALSATHDHFVALIRRYPDLSSAELSELHRHFGRLRALDLAIMMSDEELSPRLEAYCSLHGRMYRPPLAGYFLLLAFIALVAVVGLWGGLS